MPPWPKALLVLLIIAALGASLVPSAIAQAEGPPCPNEALRQESDVNPATGQPYSAQLPACRAYELVSPSDAGGYGAPSKKSPTLQFAEDGSVFFESQGTPAGTGAVGDGHYGDVFRSRRTPSGWATRDLTPFTGSGDNTLVKPSADGSAILIETALTLSPEDHDNPSQQATSGEDLYVVTEGAPPQLVTQGEIPNTAISQATSIAGAPVFANATLTAVGFESGDSLQTPFQSSTSPGCYMWADAETRLAVLTNIDQGSPPSRNCKYFGIARNGAAIIEDTSGDSESGLLYASAGGNLWLDSDNTVQLSGPTPSAARFDALSPSGETVYLTTPDQLVSNGDSDADIYAVDLASPSGLSTAPPREPAVECVSCDASGDPALPNEGAATYVSQSADGSHVFFTVAGALYEHDASGTAQVAPAADGLEHLVSSHDGQTVVATTSAALTSSDVNGLQDVYELSGSEGFAPRLITSGVSVSEAYGPDAVSDNGQQVLYDARPTGAPGVIDEWVAGQTSQISPLGAKEGYAVQGTAGGELEDIFFEAHEPLVAQDENAGTTDIYDARVGGGFAAPTEPAAESQTPNPAAPSPPSYTPSLATPSLFSPALGPDTSSPAAVSKAKSLTKAQQLAKALKTCKRDHSKAKRRACEKSARRRFAPTKKKGKG